MAQPDTNQTVQGKTRPKYSELSVEPEDLKSMQHPGKIVQINGVNTFVPNHTGSLLGTGKSLLGGTSLLQPGKPSNISAPILGHVTPQSIPNIPPNNLSVKPAATSVYQSGNLLHQSTYQNGTQLNQSGQSVQLTQPVRAIVPPNILPQNVNNVNKVIPQTNQPNHYQPGQLLQPVGNLFQTVPRPDQPILLDQPKSSVPVQPYNPVIQHHNSAVQPIRTEPLKSDPVPNGTNEPKRTLSAPPNSSGIGQNPISLPKPPKNIAFNKLLGSGAFADVYRAVTPYGEVAVKILEDPHKDNETGIPALTEVDIFARIRHDHIMSALYGIVVLKLVKDDQGAFLAPVLGQLNFNKPQTNAGQISSKLPMFATDDKGKKLPKIVLSGDKRATESTLSTPHEKSEEYLAALMPLAVCDLGRYISQDLPTVVKIETFYEICLGVYGLWRHRLLHLDLKPDNILLVPFPDNPKFACAKVTDFSFSKYTLLSDETRTNEELTLYYRPPEAFNKPGGKYEYTTKVDSWAMGLILLFIFMRRHYFDPNSKQRLTVERMYQEFGRPPIRPMLGGLTGSKTNEKDAEAKSRMIRCNTIRSHLLKCGVESEFFENMVDLLSHLLDPDPNTRWSIDQVVKHKLFGDRPEPSQGSHFQPIVNLPENPRLGHYYCFDLLILLCRSLNSSTETFFLAVDLFQRIIHSEPKESIAEPFVYKAVNRWLIRSVAVVMLMACKLTNCPNEIRISKIIEIIKNLTEVTLQNEEIRTEERRIIELLGGILYRRNFLTRVKCYHVALSAFGCLFSIYLYSRYQNPGDIVCTKCPNGYHEPIMNDFNKFYATTTYRTSRQNGEDPLVKFLYDQDQSNKARYIK